MDEREKQIRRRLRDDFKHYAKKCLKIRTKSQSIIPFEFNKAQIYVHDKLEHQKLITGKVRAIILKGRQQGMSTLIGGRFFHITTHSFGLQTFILTHALDATNNLFKMTQRYYENCPAIVRPDASRSNSKELIFDGLDSGYKIGTAENKAVGRSSTIQLFHGCLSEDSLIVLADGSTKAMREIEIGDLIVTSSGAIAPIKEKIYTGQKLAYTLDCWLSGEPIHLTADHKVLTIDGYKELKDITAADFIAMPKIELTNEINTWSFALKNKPRAQGGGSKHLEQFDFTLNYDFGYLIGYYLAEGHVKDNYAYLSFAYHKDESYIENAIKGTFGLETSIQHKIDAGTNRKRTILNGKFLASAINEICGRVANKHIPAWFFKTNPEFLEGVFKGYLDGDGSKTQVTKISAPSIHEKISRQLQRICWALYGACSVRRKSRMRYDKETKDIYLFCMSGDAMKRYQQLDPNKHKEKSIIKDGIVYSKVRSITPRKIESVWDIEVDHPDHNYQTTSGIVSNSEVAFWANASEHAKGILQAVPSEKGTEVIFESTANGVGNYFHQQWQLAEAGLSDFIAIFVPWFWQAEYQREPDADFAPEEKELALIETYGLTYAQLAWRRYKIVELSVGGDDGELGFCQEYPNSSIEAFLTSSEDSFISPELVTNARKSEAEGVGSLIIGADIARFGDDRTCFCWRRGRKIEKIVSYSKKDTMEVAGLLHLIIEKEEPKKVCIDVGGLGAGVYDRLLELGHGDIIYPVNGGSSPINSKRYLNKRAEIWGEFKEWLSEAPIQIPDLDTLHADICGTRYKVDSKGRICLEKKEDMKKRGIRSPDEADACTLTFALPESAYREIIKEKDKKVAQRITSSFARTQQIKDKRYANR
jgi:hypothetical protein